MVLQKKIQLEMKLPKEIKKENRAEKAASHGVDEGLLSKLKALRSSFAARSGVPAYIIFTDASLRDMCGKAPPKRR